MRRRDSGNFAFSFSRQFARHQINTASDQRSRFNKKAGVQNAYLENENG